MTSTRRTIAAVLAAFALVALTACTAGQNDDATSPSPGSSDAAAAPITDLSTLEGSRWELVSGRIDGEELSLPAAQAVTVMFANPDGTPMLFANGCNGLSGRLVGWPDGFSVQSMGGTEMRCVDDLMAIDDAFYAGLPRVAQVTGDASAITLTGDDVEFEFRAFPVPEPTEVFATLADRQWVLVSGTVDGSGLTLPVDQPITFAVTADDQGELSLSGHACNRWGIALKDFPDGPMMMTEIGCPDDISSFDSLISQAIMNVETVGAMNEMLLMSGDTFDLQWAEIPLAEED